uniref:NADH-ubiquinone oxidoreductase chain 3 n=1 Tax=Hydropsyche angustipennis TaxID=329908 RepID=A0A7D7A621_9NEOP|nr:NADH dehydrogenase subunit 3 [Hydropsyche angustipennis]
MNVNNSIFNNNSNLNYFNQLYFNYNFNNYFKKKKNDREKYSPFECGFDPKTSSRLPFSLQFFIITMIFLIFDVEISIILPLIISIKLINKYIWFNSIILIMIILIMGIFYEWNQSLLNWKF